MKSRETRIFSILDKSKDTLLARIYQYVRQRNFIISDSIALYTSIKEQESHIQPMRLNHFWVNEIFGIFTQITLNEIGNI